MDVLIRGFVPPNNCIECVVRYPFCKNLKCTEFPDFTNETGAVRYHETERHPQCPIIPLSAKIMVEFETQFNKEEKS